MRTLKILAVALAALALGAAAAYFWIRHAADRKWAAAQERIRRLSADHPVVLPPLPSTPASKELQIHFVAAIRAAFRRQCKVGTDPTASVLADAQDVLDRLHQGARQCAASPSDFPPGWRGEWDGATLQHIVDCCRLRALQLRERKSPGEAVETLLDALQLARFWSMSGKGESRIPAIQSVAFCTEELWDILAKEPLSRDQLLALERELEPLEASLHSPFEFLEPALARWGEWLSGLDPAIPTDRWIYEMASDRWRYVLPFDLMRAEAFEFQDFHIRRLIADRARPFRELEEHFRQMQEQLKNPGNPLLAHGVPIAFSEWVPFLRSAQFRLARIAARYRATGELLPLRDPYGDTLDHARTPDRMKFWSRGWDGVDDGGTVGKDFVLEVDHPRPE